MTPVAPLTVDARAADVTDLDELERMYEALAGEQAAIRGIWPDADGLEQPTRDALERLVVDGEAIVTVGMVDDVPLGFLIAVIEPLLASRSGGRIGTIAYIFTDHDARGVGVGDAMLAYAERDLRSRGIELFDARVSPGHRLAKNFFESHGFKARSITMHRADDGGEA